MKKIVHICLTLTYTDGFSYQENILPKYHKRLGYNVDLITSEWEVDQNGNQVLAENKDYIDENGIHIIRLRVKGNNNVNKKFKKYENLLKTLASCRPEVLFVHNLSYLDINTIRKYVCRHKEIKVFVDNHADFSNSATNVLSRYVLHGMIWRYGALKIQPYVERFYGVLPARVDFLNEVYKLDKKKCSLLVMGADDDLVKQAEQPGVREQIRKEYNIDDNDFLIVTGGKIDRWKAQTTTLMQVVKDLGGYGVKLIVFGPTDDNMKEKVASLADGEIVHYIGWISSERSYDFFAASDMAVFPGRHSVFWEQVAGQGIPMIVKSWTGTHHIDVGGNVEFLYTDEYDELKEKLLAVVTDKLRYNKMKTAALKNGKREFLYSKISNRSLGTGKQINILIAANDRIIFSVIVFLTSLFYNNTNCTVYFMYNLLSEKNKKRVIKIAQKYGQNIEFIKVDTSWLEHAPIAKHLGFETYFRLFAVEYLPLSINKILYLDVDLIVNKSLEELYNLDLDKYYVAACEDPALIFEYEGEEGEEREKRLVEFRERIYENLGFKQDEKYFNAGVLLLNIAKMRANGYNGAFFKNYIDRNHEKLLCHDQDIMNAVFHNDICCLHYLYNYRTYLIKGRTKAEIEHEINNNAICIHYVSKPWKNLDCIGSTLFWKYAKESGLYYKYALIYIYNSATKFYQRFLLPIRKKINPGRYASLKSKD